MNRCWQGRILGVFLGDEVCECGVPFSNLSSVADAAKVLSVISGYDPEDELTSLQGGRTPDVPYESFCTAEPGATKPLAGP